MSYMFGLFGMMIKMFVRACSWGGYLLSREGVVVLQCRYYRYDRSGRDVCEGDSIEDLRKSISDMADTVSA